MLPPHTTINEPTCYESTDTVPQFNDGQLTQSVEWSRFQQDSSRQAIPAKRTVYDRLLRVLKGIDCASVQKKGFAHLSEDIFEPPKDIMWIKLNELKRLAWSTLKSPQVIIWLPIINKYYLIL